MQIDIILQCSKNFIHKKFTHQDNIPEKDRYFVWFIVNLQSQRYFNVLMISLHQIIHEFC